METRKESEGDEEEFERQDSQHLDDTTLDNNPNKATIESDPFVDEQEQREIERLKVKRMKKWLYYRSLHEKSTNERHFLVNEKVFLEYAQISHTLETNSLETKFSIMLSTLM